MKSEESIQTVVCFGDSNTWGFVPGQYQSAPSRFPRGTRWTGILARELGVGYHVVEEGLSGRTTSFDDPMWEHRNGRRDIRLVIETHSPIDIFVIALGTNDLKARFRNSAADIALGLESLIEEVRAVCRRLEVTTPRIVVVIPTVILPLALELYTFVGATERSRGLPDLFREVAARQCCDIYDTAGIVNSSTIDGVHWDEESHRRFGVSFAEFLLQESC